MSNMLCPNCKQPIPGGCFNLHGEDDMKTIFTTFIATVQRMVRRHTHPYKVHVIVCGTYAGFYDFRTDAEAAADMADRKKYEILGCSYRREFSSNSKNPTPSKELYDLPKL